ncbi:trypsin-1-like [Portunus trituberculatus]|uniref:trypsin-1-like n=1 Tax=Portunus trituberculatus TaxID=210409 RepID=UPI001E1CEE1B|nr:trypsin-1-like [Portunus trituberculatus]
MEDSLILSLCFMALVITATTGASRIVFPVSVALEEGDTCTLHSGVSGRCVDIRHCDYTDVNFRQNQPIRCGFNGIFPVVCCPTTSGAGPQPVTDIAPPQVSFSCGRTDLGIAASFAVGSERADLNAWPWMALIGEQRGGNKNWFCGGVLINEQWILTALHCFFFKKADVVRLGEDDHMDDNDGALHQDFGVAEMIMYPGYTHPEEYHDLALLRLSSRVEILVKNFIIPVCLPWGEESEVDITEQTATLIGYGDTVSGGLPTTFLQQVNVTVFSSAKCDSSYSILPKYNTSWPRGIGEETLCAGDLDGGKDACQGDSGGPLVTRNKTGRYVLAGIVSQGNGCGTKNFPGLYGNTRYPPYLAWVKKVAFTV